MSAEAKRIRGHNFSPREVSHLFTLALQYKNILENKQTNGVTNSQKNEAWVKIANEFNATSSDLNNRTIDQLKKCYENKKQAMTKKKAQVRQKVLKTGGGLPPPETKKDELDDLVLAIMDLITVEGHYNQFDSDAICPILGANPETIEYMFENSENALLDEGDNESFSEATIEKAAKSTEKTNWKHFNINDLKRPLNPALLHPGMRDKNEIQGMEDEQVNDPAVGSQIEDHDLKNKRNRGNGGGRGGIRGRGTPRRGPERRRPTATLITLSRKWKGKGCLPRRSIALEKNVFN
ncbi:hypothetical protein JTB14_011210 [Gonioctena quinquepunctata]|nr:hypothetical protein JTB14_011210 [Gonioctena quinquepunctata]